MPDAMAPTRRSGPRWTDLAARAGLLLASFAATLLLVEAGLRWIPGVLPSGVYSMGQRFDPEVQSPVYTGKVIYNKVRRTEREPNRAGFLDVEHTDAPTPGVARLGFFGDSYVESAQVPLEQAFFRRLAHTPSPTPVEVLAFGISGWGTLHAFLAHRVLADRYGLDTSVYVFVENDPGDNAWSIQSRHRQNFLRRPYAELAEEAPGFRMRWIEGMQAQPLAVLLRAGYDRSLLLRVVWSRLALLSSYGVVRDRRADAAMAGSAGEVPDQNDLPTTWPRPYVEEAGELGRRILAKWAEETRSAGRRLAVLYVPRGEAQLSGEMPDGETWKPWLIETCRALGIPLIDPSPELRARLAAGESVYDDHWSPAGHAAVADALARSLLPGVAPGHE